MFHGTKDYVINEFCLMEVSLNDKVLQTEICSNLLEAKKIIENNLFKFNFSSISDGVWQIPTIGFNFKHFRILSTTKLNMKIFLSHLIVLDLNQLSHLILNQIWLSLERGSHQYQLMNMSSEIAVIMSGNKTKEVLVLLFALLDYKCSTLRMLVELVSANTNINHLMSQGISNKWKNSIRRQIRQLIKVENLMKVYIKVIHIKLRNYPQSLFNQKIELRARLAIKFTRLKDILINYYTGQLYLFCVYLPMFKFWFSNMSWIISVSLSDNDYYQNFACHICLSKYCYTKYLIELFFQKNLNDVFQIDYVCWRGMLQQIRLYISRKIVSGRRLGGLTETMTGLRWQDMMSNTRNSLNETLSGVPEHKAVNCRILIYDSSLRVI